MKGHFRLIALHDPGGMWRLIEGVMGKVRIIVEFIRYVDTVHGRNLGGRLGRPFSILQLVSISPPDLG